MRLAASLSHPTCFPNSTRPAIPASRRAKYSGVPALAVMAHSEIIAVDGELVTPYVLSELDSECQRSVDEAEDLAGLDGIVFRDALFDQNAGRWGRQIDRDIAR